MRHLLEIESYVNILLRSRHFHALAVLGQSGIGKTTSVNDGLRRADREATHLGSSSTALAFYNALYSNSGEDSIVVLADTAGLLHSPVAMSLLCAAGCPGSEIDSPRFVRWGSTTSKVDIPEFTFAGKIILLTNFLPETPQSKAFQSRALVLKVVLKPDEVAEVLTKAAESIGRFPDREAAEKALAFSLHQLEQLDLAQVSLRTLMQVYEFALLGGNGWHALAEGLLPKVTTARPDPLAVVAELQARGGPVREQQIRFTAATGLQQRMYFYYRDRLALPKQTHKSKSRELEASLRQ